MAATTFLNFGPELDKVLSIVSQLLKLQTDRAEAEAKILAALAVLNQKIDDVSEKQDNVVVSLLTQGDTLNAIRADVEMILTWPGTQPDRTPATVRFVTITRRDPVTGEPINMARSLINDATSNIPLEFDNLAGQPVDPPAGGTVTISMVNPDGSAFTSGSAALGADGKSVDVTPMPFDGSVLGPFTLNFEDMATADLKASLDCEFTNDPTAANVHFVTTGITTRPVSP